MGAKQTKQGPPASSSRASSGASSDSDSSSSDGESNDFPRGDENGGSGLQVKAHGGGGGLLTMVKRLVGDKAAR
jgi:hypothetical protein